MDSKIIYVPNCPWYFFQIWSFAGHMTWGGHVCHSGRKDYRIGRRKLGFGILTIWL